MLKFHVARTPLMLISNGFESSPEFAGDDGALLSFPVTGSPSSLLWIDDASLRLLLLCLLENTEKTVTCKLES